MVTELSTLVETCTLPRGDFQGVQGGRAPLLKLLFTKFNWMLEPSMPHIWGPIKIEASRGSVFPCSLSNFQNLSYSQKCFLNVPSKEMLNCSPGFTMILSSIKNLLMFLLLQKARSLVPSWETLNIVKCYTVGGDKKE